MRNRLGTWTKSSRSDRARKCVYAWFRRPFSISIGVLSDNQIRIVAQPRWTQHSIVVKFHDCGSHIIQYATTIMQHLMFHDLRLTFSVPNAFVQQTIEQAESTPVHRLISHDATIRQNPTMKATSGSY